MSSSLPIAPTSPVTTVADLLRDWSGQNFIGTISVVLESIRYRFARSYNVSNGTFSINLYAGTYSVTISSAIFGVQRNEVWIVPASSLPQTLSNVGSPSALITGGGGGSGDGVPTSREINTDAPLTGGGDLSSDLTLGIDVFTGDSGSGGFKGAVPAPAPGDAAAGKVLGAGGSFVAVPSSGNQHELSFWLFGNATVGTNVLNEVILGTGWSIVPSGARGILKGAPTGSSLVAVICANGTPWLTYTFPAGVSDITLSGADILAAGATPAGAILTLNVTAVGSTTPGNDLNVAVWTTMTASGTLIPGDPGTPGAPGSPGAPGAPGTAGQGLTWRGAYGSGSYVPYDLVSFNGSCYVCILATTGHDPTNSTYWSLAAAAGTPGTPGTNGIDGNTVLSGSGAPGSGLGVIGNFYINNTAHAIYGPKTGGGWGSATSLIGTPGTNGVGIPTGGTSGQVLAKIDGTDYNTQWVAAGGGSSAPASYFGPASSGNRRNLMTVTGTVGISGNIECFIGPTDSGTLGYLNGGTVSGKTISFDFGVALVITEAKWNQSSAAAQGVWQWQSSDDNSTWTDIGANFTITSAATVTLTELNANTTAHRYYRLLGVSGSTNSGPYTWGMQFKSKFG